MSHTPLHFLHQNAEYIWTTCSYYWKQNSTR
jgi:hypothetical protein